MKNVKAKGTRWERDAVDLLSKLIPNSTWKRIAGSGAIGTILGEPLLTGDVVGSVFGLPGTIRAEAKTGYGGSTQLALKREWLEKIREEAESTYSLPLLLGKFSGSRGRVKHFVAMDFEAFAKIMNLISELSEELEHINEVYDELRLRMDGLEK